VKYIATFAQKIRGAAADNHAVSCGGCFLHHLLTNRDEHVGIEWFFPRCGHVLFIAATQERVNQASKCVIGAFLTAFHGGILYICKFRDFFRERMVPEFPAQAVRQLTSDLSGAGSVFPLDCDDSIQTSSVT